jgi:hypothetical protein
MRSSSVCASRADRKHLSASSRYSLALGTVRSLVLKSFQLNQSHERYRRDESGSLITPAVGKCVVSVD